MAVHNCIYLFQNLKFKIFKIGLVGPTLNLIKFLIIMQMTKSGGSEEN